MEKQAISWIAASRNLQQLASRWQQMKRLDLICAKYHRRREKSPRHTPGVNGERGPL
jgi:hypothetical protein